MSPSTNEDRVEAGDYDDVRGDCERGAEGGLDASFDFIAAIVVRSAPLPVPRPAATPHRRTRGGR